MKIKSLMYIVVSSLITASSSANAETITDDFSNTNNWGSVITSANANMEIEGGRMNFSCTTTDNSFGAILRDAPFLPTTQDWSLKADAHINPFPLTQEEQFTDVFLGFGITDDWIDNHVTFEFDRGWWYSNSYGYDIQDDVAIGGETTPDLFFEGNLINSDVSLRLDYNASNQSITYYFDNDGWSNGYNWVSKGTANLMSGTYDMNLHPTNTFTILLVGSSEHQTVASGQAYLDNLEITMLFSPPVIENMGFVSNKFDFSVIEESGLPVVIESSTNLVNWVPIQTNITEGSSFLFSDPVTSNSNQRFYRGILQLQ